MMVHHIPIKILEIVIAEAASVAPCRAASLKAGHAIRYEGPGGPTNFDSFHDSTGIFQIDTYSADGTVNVTGNLSADQLRAVSG